MESGSFYGRRGDLPALAVRAQQNDTGIAKTLGDATNNN